MDLIIGDELDVLRGVMQPDWSLIQQVVLEAHNEPGRLAEIRQLLSDQGFAVFVDVDEELGRLGNYMVYALKL